MFEIFLWLVHGSSRWKVSRLAWERDIWKFLWYAFYPYQSLWKNETKQNKSCKLKWINWNRKIDFGARKSQIMNIAKFERLSHHNMKYVPVMYNKSVQTSEILCQTRIAISTLFPLTVLAKRCEGEIEIDALAAFCHHIITSLL